ncbi:hypothetical protein EDD17DRAFT_1634342 [Pisolithus thermaeus]|nr:hypothetical protein EDD17DRAFT_1634342 [Pisolithus thermaeus]
MAVQSHSCSCRPPPALVPLPCAYYFAFASSCISTMSISIHLCMYSLICTRTQFWCACRSSIDISMATSSSFVAPVVYFVLALESIMECALSPCTFVLLLVFLSLLPLVSKCTCQCIR